MEQYISKSALVAEIKRISCENPMDNSWYVDTEELLNFINTLEVIDPYEQYIQYPSIEDGIKAHAETYSFNIESKLFNQLTKEQQELWRKEIEQAVISGGEAGVELARDKRYKENLEVKEVDLEKEIQDLIYNHFFDLEGIAIAGTSSYATVEDMVYIAKHFFELGLRYKSSYVSTSNIDDTLKEMGINPDSKIVKTFKELYCIALEELKEKKGI